MVSVLCLMLEMFSWLLCLYSFYNKKFRFDKYNVLLLVIEVTSMFMINQFRLPSLLSLCIYPMLFVFCLLEFGRDIGQIIINIIFGLLVVGCMQLLGDLIYVLIFGENEMLEIIVANAFLLVIALVIKRFVPVYRIAYYLKSKQKSVIVIVAIVGIIAIGYILYFKLNHEIDAFTIITVLLVFIIYASVCEWQKNRVLSEELQKELETERLYAQSFEGLITNIRRRQHEFNNHINTLRGLQMTYTDYEDLVKAQNEYCGQIDYKTKFAKLLSGGNPIINGYLYSKFMEVDEKEIEIVYNISYDKISDTIPNHKIIEILGNLIDNAVDVIQKHDEDEKQIMVNIVDDECLSMEVRNRSEYISMEESMRFFEKGYSTKGNERGLGLYNVKQLCKQYNIDILCDNITINDKNWFGIVLLIR